MKRAIEQDTLAALVETGAAREFRVLRDGEAWRLELRPGAVKARTGQTLALTDGGGAVLRRGGDQGTDGGTLIKVELTRYLTCNRRVLQCRRIAIQ